MKVTVNEKDTKINWGKSQLVVSTNGHILLTSGNQRDGSFEATVISTIPHGVEIGCCQFFAISESYTLFKGSITLQND